MASEETTKGPRQAEKQHGLPLLSTNSSKSSTPHLSLPHQDVRGSGADGGGSRLREAHRYPEPDSSEVTSTEQSTSTSPYSSNTDGDFHRSINPRHWEHTASFSLNKNNHSDRASLIGNVSQSLSRIATTPHVHGRGTLSQSQRRAATTSHSQTAWLSQSKAASSHGREYGAVSSSQRQSRGGTTTRGEGREYGALSTSHGQNPASVSASQGHQGYCATPQSRGGREGNRGETGVKSDSQVKEAAQKNSISENTVCASNRLKKELATGVGDRRNEFFTLKRYIFMTLGMPDTPAVTRKMQRISTCLAIPFYISLFVWGIAIFIVAIQSDGWIWTGRCPEIIPAKVLTMLAGTFFVSLGLYWLYVLRWSRSGVDVLPLPYRSFSAIALLWWTLCMYFFGIAAALATEVFENSHLVASLGNATNEEYSSLSVRCGGSEDYLEVPNNLVPLWALISMALLWVLYIGVFVIATISIYSVQ